MSALPPLMRDEFDMLVERTEDIRNDILDGFTDITEADLDENLRAAKDHINAFAEWVTAHLRTRLVE